MSRVYRSTRTLRRCVLQVSCGLLLAACMSSADRPPVLRSDGAFIYPAAAQQQHIEGYVVVAYEIDANGYVVAPHVVEAQPPGVFDEAALAYVRGRIHTPARRAGVAVVTQRTSRIAFKFGDTSAY